MREVSLIMDAAVVAYAQIGARTWYEWIDSKSNPSDGLSREGLSCEVAGELCTFLCEFPPLALIPSAPEMLSEMKNVGIALSDRGTVGKV